jgi:hypothetical protein
MFDSPQLQYSPHGESQSASVTSLERVPQWVQNLAPGLSDSAHLEHGRTVLECGVTMNTTTPTMIRSSPGISHSQGFDSWVQLWPTP